MTREAVNLDVGCRGRWCCGGGGRSIFCRAMVLFVGWKSRGRDDSGSRFVEEFATSSIISIIMDRINPLAQFTVFGTRNSRKANGRKWPEPGRHSLTNA